MGNVWAKPLPPEVSRCLLCVVRLGQVDDKPGLDADVDGNRRITRGDDALQAKDEGRGGRAQEHQFERCRQELAAPAKATGAAKVPHRRLSGAR